MWDVIESRLYQIEPNIEKLDQDLNYEKLDLILDLNLETFDIELDLNSKNLI